MHELYTKLQQLHQSTTIYPIVYSSYKELCQLLNLPIFSNPTSKASQLEMLEQFCKLRCKGRKYMIDTIYSSPAIILKFDSRATYQELLVKNLIDFLYGMEVNDNEVNGAVRKKYLTRGELATKLGLCAESFYKLRTHTERDARSLLKNMIEDGKVQDDGMRQMYKVVGQFFQVNSIHFSQMIESMVSYIVKKNLMIVIPRYQQCINYKWQCTTLEDDAKLMELHKKLQQTYQLSPIECYELMAKLSQEHESEKKLDYPAANFARNHLNEFDLSYYHRPVYELVYTKTILQLLVQKNHPDYTKLREQVLEKQKNLYDNFESKLGGTYDTHEKARLAWEVLVGECIIG